MRTLACVGSGAVAWTLLSLVLFIRALRHAPPMPQWMAELDDQLRSQGR